MIDILKSLKKHKYFSIDDFLLLLGDSREFLKTIDKDSIDMIFADPPFFKDDIYPVIENIFNNKYLRNDGLVIIERSIQTKEKDFSNFKVKPFKILGDNCLYELKY